MTRLRLTGRLGVLALTLSWGIATPQAGASVDELALNGVFRATSNGDFAQRNDSYKDEWPIQSVWTIASACEDAFDCSGTVTSDHGWTAQIHKTSQSWTVERQLPNWVPCEDGTAYPGRQLFRFWRVTEFGSFDLTNQSTVYAGEDKTTGPSGACGRSQILVIRMPFRLEKIG